MRVAKEARLETSKVMKASGPRPNMMHRAVFLWSQPMLVRSDSVEIMGIVLDLVLQYDLRSESLTSLPTLGLDFAIPGELRPFRILLRISMPYLVP